MTLTEFKSLAYEGIVIECLTTQQRREVLELFEECGFNLGRATRVYIFPDGDGSTTYMHPAFNPDESRVCCYKKFERAAEDVTNAIRYEDVRSLIENLPPLDDRSEAEFASAFVSLLS